MSIHLVPREATLSTQARDLSAQARARREKPSHRAEQTGPLLAWGIAVIELILGYEWLLSALNKLMNQDYVRDFAPMLLQMALPGNPHGWWTLFIEHAVLPAAPQWARLIEVGELGVALGCLGGALLWASGQFPQALWARWLNIGVLCALAAGVLMTLNYAWMNGTTFPWIQPSDPFDEGLSLDSLMTGIGISLFLLHLFTWWTPFRSRLWNRRHG